MRTVIALAFLLAVAGWADAQTASGRGEVFVSVASAHIFRVEDRTFGDRPDIGGGLRLPLARRVGVEFEINRALGLEADPAPCALLLGCVGTARDGLLDATLATANVYVHFPRGRADPFVVGGAGALWTTGVNSITFVRDGIGVLSEVEQRDRGLAIGVGAGVDIALSRRLSLRPEFRIYDSTAMSRMNLTVFRTSLAAGWKW